MAPGRLKLAISWPEYCMKADISHTYIKPTNSFGKPMVCCIPHDQFASKMAQDRDKIRPRSDQSRSKPNSIRSKSDPIAFDRLHVVLGWPKLAPRWLHERPSRHPDGPMCTQVGFKMDYIGLKTGPTWPQVSLSWLQVGPKIA